MLRARTALMVALTLLLDGSLFELGHLGVRVASAESHTLYLNYQGDSSFPEFSDNLAAYHTSPLAAFGAVQLGVGLTNSDTTTLRQNSLNIVRDAFSEFDVLVTDRKPLGGRYQTVGIDYQAGWPLVGLADDEDYNADDQDYARVWSGSLAQLSAFTGSGATIDRWSRGIGYTIAHEAAHNYGANHQDAIPTWYEQANGIVASDHIMATGGDITPEQRATKDRVFSDTSYQTLAASLGLRARTLWNWQVVNPNAQHADSFHIVFDSNQSDLTFAWEYNGDPFLAPTLFHLGESQGVTRYELVWSGGAGVEAGNAFRAGISFRESNDFHIVDSYLSQAGKPLPNHPPIVSYRAVFDGAGSGYLELQNETAQAVVVRDFRLREIPRLVDLDRMTSDDLELLWSRPLGGALHASDAERRLVVPSQDVQFKESFDLPPQSSEIIDLLHLPVSAGWSTMPALSAIAQATSVAGVDVPVSIDTLASIDAIRWRDRQRTQDRLFDEPALLEGGTVPSGLTVLPSTYLYGSAHVVLPNQTLWDPVQKAYVTSDYVTELFFQLAGVADIPPWATTDFNFDGSVDAADAGYMFGFWGRSDPMADVLPDGIVDAGDAGVMFEQWTADGRPGPTPHVPEPGGGLLSVIAWGWCRGGRRFSASPIDKHRIM